jgi:hypothetical protein
MAAIWLATVRVETPRSLAICALVLPRAAARATARSAAVNMDGSATVTGAG